MTHSKYEGNPSAGFPDFEWCIKIALLSIFTIFYLQKTNLFHNTHCDLT